MSKDVVMAYWIEARSGALRSETMGPNDLMGHGSYEAEVRLKLAADPVEVVVIPLAQLGNDWARAEVERLRTKSLELTAAIESARPASSS